MLEQIPNIFKRERRRDVIEKGPQSQHFFIALQRMVQLLEEMEESLSEHDWLAGENYTLADVAFTPYLARLDHLNMLRMAEPYAKVRSWYARCQQRPSFEEGIRRWENPDYLRLMKEQGEKHWPEVSNLISKMQKAA
jgi:glutathione S-transferase